MCIFRDFGNKIFSKIGLIWLLSLPCQIRKFWPFKSQVMAFPPKSNPYPTYKILVYRVMQCKLLFSHTFSPMDLDKVKLFQILVLPHGNKHLCLLYSFCNMNYLHIYKSTIIKRRINVFEYTGSPKLNLCFFATWIICISTNQP